MSARQGVVCTWHVVALILGLMTPGIGDAQGTAPHKVTVILDWDGTQPQHMPYWIARERGWYAERGLDVRIMPGRGSGQVAQAVVAGQAEFGQMTPVVLAQAVAKQGAPLRMVGLTLQKDTISLRYFRNSGIATPRDLEGRTVGLVPGSVGDLLWPAFARATGIDASRVRTVGVDFRGYDASFVAGQTEATNSALGYHGNVTLARKGRPVGEFVYSDHLPMPGFGIAVSLRTLADRPEMIQQFVRATQMAWEYLIRSPGEAVSEGARIIGRQVEGAPDEGTLVEASLRIIPQFRRARSTEGRPIGWSNPEDWQSMMTVLRQYDTLPRVPAVSELMTNRFVE